MIKVIHDGDIDISDQPKFSDPLKHIRTTWSKFINQIAKSVETHETHKEYKKMSKDQQGIIKHVGGFVGGMFNGTQRLKNNLISRSVLTLDVDNGVMGQFEDFNLVYGCAAAMYSTHSHSEETPSYRIIIPLLRPVNGDEFEAVSRKVVQTLDPKLKQFCSTSFVRHQIMFWPSHSIDVTPVFEFQDGEWLDPDQILNSYGDWTDLSSWNLDEVKLGAKQEDPLLKEGHVGIFCRAYTIHEAIDKFIPDYKRSEHNPEIYTYIKGSTSNGVKTYDGKYAYSHHSTDPISEMLCNAFDLVRHHLYDSEDDGAKPKTPGNKMPSYKKMIDLMDKDRSCKTLRLREKQEKATMEFSSVAIGDDGEIKKIETPQTPKKIGNKFESKVPKEADMEILGEKLEMVQGMITQTRQNILSIFEYDSNLKDMIRYDEFAHIDVVSQLPWRMVTHASNTFTDLDHSCLRRYFETFYRIDNAQKVQDAFNEILNHNHFHPVREYLNGLKWDGIKRIESLMIDYLGADDTLYVRTTTRKMLVAAVARIFQPGIKFDTMMVFVGPQGKGKSWLIGKLGGIWFSDTLGNIHNKEAMESLQGVWLLEVGELSQFKRADVEAVKGFISKSRDRFRPSYGRTTANYPRQSVFFGSTNEMEPLVDQTGNRRYWPIDVIDGVPTKSVAVDLTQSEVNQIWAEAVEIYNFSDEELILPEELYEDALKAQEQFTQSDDREDYIRNFLDLKLPVDWDKMSMWDRRGYIDGDELQEIGTVTRSMVSVHEIWVELMKEDKAKMTPGSTKYIHNIMRKMSGWKQYKGKMRVKPYGIVRVYVREEVATCKNEFSDLM